MLQKDSNISTGSESPAGEDLHRGNSKSLTDRSPVASGQSVEASSDHIGSPELPSKEGTLAVDHTAHTFEKAIDAAAPEPPAETGGDAAAATCPVSPQLLAVSFEASSLGGEDEDVPAPVSVPQTAPDPPSKAPVLEMPMAAGEEIIGGPAINSLVDAAVTADSYAMARAAEEAAIAQETAAKAEQVKAAQVKAAEEEAAAKFEAAKAAKALKQKTEISESFQQLSDTIKDVVEAIFYYTYASELTVIMEVASNSSILHVIILLAPLPLVPPS